MSAPILDVPLEVLRRRGSMKWRTYDGDVLPLWVAEMDCRPAPVVSEALARAIADGDTGYPYGHGYPEAFLDFAASRWGWQADPADAVIVPDVMQGVVRALDLLTAPGDRVVIDSPTYNCFFGYLPWGGRQVLEVPLDAAGRLDLAGIERAYAGAEGAAPTAHLLCNPQNPTGTVHTAEELAGLVDLAAQYGVALISDEIHAPLVTPSDSFTPIGRIVDGDAAVVTITSASKAWNLPGLKAAVAVGTPRTGALLRTLPTEVTHGASYLGELSHRVALTEARDWLDQLSGELEVNRSHLHQRLVNEAPGLTPLRGAATYLAWVDCAGLGQADPAEYFQTRARVAFSPGGQYGRGGQQHVRINFATSPALLDEAVDRVIGALA